jgi:hypothetical protein
MAAKAGLGAAKTVYAPGGIKKCLQAPGDERAVGLIFAQWCRINKIRLGLVHSRIGLLNIYN